MKKQLYCVLIFLVIMCSQVTSYNSQINDPTLVFIEDSKHSAASLESIGASDEDIDISQELLFARFEEWSKTYSKQYNSEEERNYRFSIWMKNDGEFYMFTFFALTMHTHVLL